MTSRRVTFQTVTEGSYVAPDLLPGNYEVTVQKEGFKQYGVTGISIGVGQRVRVDASLHWAFVVATGVVLCGAACFVVGIEKIEEVQ